MGETRQPNTLYLAFVFFFTLAIATRTTTGSVNCRSLSYPTSYWIEFDCSEYGTAKIGEFHVDEVTDANIYVNIPPMCERKIGKIEQLFRENLAPSNLNTILVRGCNESSNNCVINPTLFRDQSNLGRCMSPVSCLNGATTTTTDVMSVGDVVNGSGCNKYWFSSILTESSTTTSEVSYNFGRLKLDWWLEEGCSDTTCSKNANCTQVNLPDSRLGHRYTCLEGFDGDAYDVYGCGDPENYFIRYISDGGCSRLGSNREGLGSLAGIVLIMGLVSLFLRYLWKRQMRHRQQNVRALIPLKHYTYAQVKRITKSFPEVVGRGGFGIVYRGTLSDGRMVAVKVLKDSKSNGEDFINEVASMSQTAHVNIVSLLDFCSEGSKRAIIYEYLGNGSLDKFISGKASMNMDLKTLYGISLGVARGVDYLHHGCKKRIVHFDIKPHNVLLDDDYSPKVSDFGLAKLCEKKESILSLMETRGTIGYIAPEMISQVYGSVSHKSDVYSYGMLVLEMIGARKKEIVDQNSESNASSMYFPEWIYKDLEKGDNGSFIENGISSEEEEILRKMTLVGLWCIQSSPSNRPPMNRVVGMMEGSLEALEVPPRPVLQQIPTTPLSESSWISEESSIASEVLICSTD